MKNFVQHRALSLFLLLLLSCSRATADSARPELPPEVVMNKGAGRGNCLTVSVRVESGEDLTFLVDTGCNGSVIDKSFEPKLGPRVHPFNLWTMYGTQESGLYAAPKLFLKDTPLMTGRLIATYDFKKTSVFRRAGIMGILGMDCLSHYCIQLDFEAGKMRFRESDRLNPTELGKAFPIEFSPIRHDNQVFSCLSTRQSGLLGGANANVMIDVGYNNDGVIEKGVIKGHFFARLAHFLIPFRDLRVSKCKWDSNTYTKLRVGTGWNAIGLRFLARHLVTFDFPNHVMYLKQTRSTPLGAPNREL